MSGWGYVPEEIRKEFGDDAEMRSVMEVYGISQKHGGDALHGLFREIKSLQKQIAGLRTRNQDLAAYIESLEEKLSKQFLGKQFERGMGE